jgi:hypothetical protein
MTIRQRPGTGNQEHAAGYTGFTWRPASLERKHQTWKNAIKIRMLQDAAVPPNLTDGELNHFGDGSRPKWHLKILENYNFCIFLRPACKMRRGNASDVGENFRVNQGPVSHTSSRPPCVRRPPLASRSCRPPPTLFSRKGRRPECEQRPRSVPWIDV